MSIIFMATSLSAVGASALTVGAFALRARLAAGKKKRADEKLTPIASFAAEHAVLAGATHSAVIQDTSDTFRWNTLRLDDPQKAVADFSAFQTALTRSDAVSSERLNASIALPGGQEP